MGVSSVNAASKKRHATLRQADKPTRFTIGVNSTMLCGADCGEQSAWRMRASSVESQK
jgi:hypothetical protein